AARAPRDRGPVRDRAAAGRGAQHGDPRVALERLRDLVRAVVRRMVGDDQLEIHFVLGEHRSDGLGEHTGLAERGHDDRELGRCHWVSFALRRNENWLCPNQLITAITNVKTNWATISSHPSLSFNGGTTSRFSRKLVRYTSWNRPKSSQK